MGAIAVTVLCAVGGAAGALMLSLVIYCLCRTMRAEVRSSNRIQLRLLAALLCCCSVVRVHH